jgi:hypothetical protein
MRPLLLPLCLLLSACAGPLPKADPQLAWVTLSTLPGNSFMAHSHDGVPATDGRYFQLQPGQHVLHMRLQFEVSAAGYALFTAAQTRTCLFALSYAGFAAGQQYQLKSGQQGYNGWVRLYDQQHKLLARAKQLRCGAV